MKDHDKTITKTLVYIRILLLLCLAGIVFLCIYHNDSLKELEKICSNNATKVAVVELKNIKINDDLGLTKTIYDFPVLVDMKDGFVSRSLLMSGTWQNEIVRLLEKIVKPGMKVLHLGGHIGFDDVLLGKLVGKNGKVVVFEPNPRSLNVLRKNIMLHGLEDMVEIHGLAAWSEKGKKKLCFSYKNTGEARFVEGNSNMPGSDECMDLVMTDVDSAVKSLDKIDILFMDIEGAELHAIRGAEKLLAKSPNAIIVMEWEPGMINHFGLRVEDFVKEKLQQKYKFFRVGDGKELGYDDLVRNQHCDIVLIPPTLNPKLLK